MEERDGIGDSLDIGWNMKPYTELVPLDPGGRFFLLYCERNLE